MTSHSTVAASAYRRSSTASSAVLLDRSREGFEEAHARGERIQRWQRFVRRHFGKQPRDVEPVGAQPLQPFRMGRKQVCHRAE
jgi:hypothetical protein